MIEKFPQMGLPKAQKQRIISEAYIRAIVANAGCDIEIPGQIDTGEDFEIIPITRNEMTGKLGKPLRPIHIQLKSSYDYKMDKERIPINLP